MSLIIIFTVWGIIGYKAWQEVKPKSLNYSVARTAALIKPKRKYDYCLYGPKPADFREAKYGVSPATKMIIQRERYRRRVLNDAFMLGVFFGSKIEKKRAGKLNSATSFLRE